MGCIFGNPNPADAWYNDRLQFVSSVFPGTRGYTAFIDDDGQYLYEQYPNETKEEPKPCDLDFIVTLKRTAAKMSKILTNQQMNCIHVRTRQNIFSCYNLENKDDGSPMYLVFYSTFIKFRKFNFNVLA